MGRTIVAVFLGWAASLVVIVAMEALSHHLFPLPPGSDVWNASQLAAAGPAIPSGALALVLAGWMAGALAGGFLAGRLVQRRQHAHAVAVGLVVLASAIWTMLTLPHPAWMWVASILLIPAAGWVGGALAMGMTRRPSRAAP